MGRKRRLAVSLNRDEAVTVTRVSIGKQKLAYVLVADKKLNYPKEKSRIAYIGTTKKGISRISQSVAYRSHDILALRGVRSFQARVVSCQPRQNVKTWHKLERALLLVFRDRFGDVPVCNSHGSKMRRMKEFYIFSEKKIKSIIDELS
jgi:hypothetical protein